MQTLASYPSSPIKSSHPPFTPPKKQTLRSSHFLTILSPFLLSLLCLLSSSHAQQIGAQEAFKILELHTKGKLPREILEVQGIKGEPQPQQWKFILADPRAMGGAREYIVKAKKVVSERTPIHSHFRSTLKSSMKVNDIILDTHSVFITADREARRAGVGFDSVTYELRRQSAYEEPTWLLDLFDWQGRQVGRVGISALTLEITEPLQPPDWAIHGKQENKGEYHYKGGVLGKAERFIRRTGDSLKRGVNRLMGNIQEWLTGERTIGTEETY
ncbi:MAG: hypothetical protein N2035_08385 [Chthoniobacterales bacterium]|nr:hypothetical protein [Chthoniobacterales bacterium]